MQGQSRTTFAAAASVFITAVEQSREPAAYMMHCRVDIGTICFLDDGSNDQCQRGLEGSIVDGIGGRGPHQPNAQSAQKSAHCDMLGVGSLCRGHGRSHVSVPQTGVSSIDAGTAKVLNAESDSLV